MTEKRNIVIKVSYPVTGKSAGHSPPQVITEWNVKRIALAAAVLILILTALGFVITGDTGNTDSENGTELVIPPEPVAFQAGETETSKPVIPERAAAKTHTLTKPEKESTLKNKPAAGIAGKVAEKKPSNKEAAKDQDYLKLKHNVSRAVLTYKINNKEPGDEIARVIGISPKKPAWIYYFTELKAMKGSKVYHEWLKNGIVVSRQELTIPDHTWRTSSRKLLSASDQGKWSVRLLDKSNRVLNEKNFKVE